MASISMWSRADGIDAKFDARFPLEERCIRVNIGACDVMVGLTTEEAIKLRNDLSLAITEAAQQHAQTVAKDAQAVTE